jgi:hypothetical protein
LKRLFTRGGAIKEVYFCKKEKSKIEGVNAIKAMDIIPISWKLKKTKL